MVLEDAREGIESELPGSKPKWRNA